MGSWRPGRPWGCSLGIHPQASAPSCLPRIRICQPGHEAVCWLSDQSLLSAVQGQRVTTWLVSLEQQHSSLQKEIPFLFYEASTLVAGDSRDNLLCCRGRWGGTDCFWPLCLGREMTLACFSTPPPCSGSIPSYHHSNTRLRGLCLRQPKVIQEGVSGQRVHKAGFVFISLCSKGWVFFHNPKPGSL